MGLIYVEGSDLLEGITFYTSEKFMYVAKVAKGFTMDSVPLAAKTKKEAIVEARELEHCKGVEKVHIWSTSYYGQITPDGLVVLHQYDHNMGQLRTEILNKDHALISNEGVRAHGRPLATRSRKERIVDRLLGMFEKYGVKTIYAIDDKEFMKRVYNDNKDKVVRVKR